MARSIKPEEGGDDIKHLPTRSGKCSVKGCENKPEWYPVFSVLPDHPDQETFPPMKAEIGLQFCDQHKDDDKSKLLASVILRCKLMVKPSDLCDIDEKTAKIEMKPLSEAIIK